MFLSFPVIGFPEADDANAIFGLAEHKDVQPVVEIAKRHIPGLGVIFPDIFPKTGRLEVKVVNPLK
jgi:hypothetical protein